MTCMDTKKRSYLLESDIVEAFDAWAKRTAMERQRVVQLGIWLVINMDPATRQDRLDEMLDRHEAPAEPAKPKAAGQRVRQAAAKVGKAGQRPGGRGRSPPGKRPA